jgi:hypothetical protein
MADLQVVDRARGYAGAPTVAVTSRVPDYHVPRRDDVGVEAGPSQWVFWAHSSHARLWFTRNGMRSEYRVPAARGRNVARAIRAERLTLEPLTVDAMTALDEIGI